LAQPAKKYIAFARVAYRKSQGLALAYKPS